MRGVVFGDGGWWAKRVLLFFLFSFLLLISCGQDRMSHGFCRGEGGGGCFFWGGGDTGYIYLMELPLEYIDLSALQKIMPA